MRFFRTANAALYESIRLQLDAAWGHPNEQTATCIDPVGVAPRDAEGRILLAVDDAFAGYEPVPSMLPGLLAGGVEEIAASDYQPVPSLPG